MSIQIKALLLSSESSIFIQPQPKLRLTQASILLTQIVVSTDPIASQMQQLDSCDPFSSSLCYYSYCSHC